MITAALLVLGAMKASTVKGVPLATLAVPAALEAPAKNVSVTPMAHCLCPVTPSQDCARAALEPRAGSVTAVSTGMPARARSVFFVEMNAQAFY